MAEGRPRFGEQPLPQTVAAAGAVRRLVDLLLALEHEHPTVDAMLGQFAEWERELAGGDPRRSLAADRTGQHRGSARVPGPRLRHRRVQPVLSRVRIRPSRRRYGVGARDVPARVRRSAGTGQRWLPRRLLRLRHTTPELRLGADRQDPVADGDLPSADSDPHRARLRRRPRRNATDVSRPRLGCFWATRCCPSANSPRRLRRRTS